MGIFDACPSTTPQDMKNWALDTGLVAGPDAPRRPGTGLAGHI